MDVKISILMSTYNGEKYIEEQMESLMKQSVKADEVVIIDDCSTDNTTNIIRKFIFENDLDGIWSLKVNPANKGWKYNFRNGLNQLSGKYIFFCDQDDIWLPDKIKKTIEVFDRNDTINVIGMSMIHFYADGHERLEGLFDYKEERTHYKKDASNFKPHPAGCAMAIRKSYVEKMMVYYLPTWSHDEFFWRYATVDNTCILLHESYIRHRVSDTNVTNLPLHSINKRTEAAYNNMVNYKQLYEYCEENNKSEDTLCCIKYYAEGNELRYEFLKAPSLIKIIKLLVKYRNIFLSGKQLMGDIAFGYKNKLFSKK
jgi:glycosyltransferase involved in cell wall biosynthesis